MRKSAILAALVLAVLAAVPCVAAELVVAGAPEELEENIRAYVGPLPEDGGDMGRGFKRRVSEQVQQAAAALGYYSPRIEVVREGDDAAAKLRVQIDPGPRVSLRQVDVGVSGEARNDPVFAKLLEDLPLRRGMPLHHGQYEQLKREIQNLALRRGYFDGEFTTQRVEVDAVANTASVDLQFASGSRYRIGELRISETPFRRKLLDRLMPVAEGDPYEAGEVAELNRALLESRYFEDVRVRPLVEEAEDGRVPILVELTPVEPNRVGVGVGYSTDIGPRFRLSWAKPWLNSRGHSLLTELEVAERRQAVSGAYRIPLGVPNRDYIELTTGYIHEDIEDTESERISAAVQRQQLLNSGWIRSGYLRLERESYTIGERSGDTTLVLPGLSFSRTRSRGGIAPTWGDRQNVVLEATDEALGSDISLVRLRLGTRWLRSYGRHGVFVRADLGALETSDFDDVPPSLRFFAGGDQSVRGFDLNTLGPRDANGDVVGGRYLLTASAEYSYEVRPRWRGVLFVDTGNAMNDWSEPLVVSLGTGVHWISPVGPVRVEVAWGVSEDDLPWEFHIGIGPRF